MKSHIFLIINLTLSTTIFADDAWLNSEQISAMRGHCSQELIEVCAKEEQGRSNIDRYNCLQKNKFKLGSNCSKIVNNIVEGIPFLMPTFDQDTNTQRNTAAEIEAENRRRAGMSPEELKKEDEYQKEREKFLKQFMKK